MSLRYFHLIFILCAIVGADLYGVWAVDRYGETKDPLVLALGLLCLVGGLGLAGYALWFGRKSEREHLP